VYWIINPQTKNGDSAMEDTQSKMWFSGVAFIPYLALAGLYTWFIDGHQHDFWVAAGVLIGGRVLYAVLDSIMSTVAWRAATTTGAATPQTCEKPVTSPSETDIIGPMADGIRAPAS
jgi:hypothetical protein